jgi:hypothetical protein
MLVVILNVVLKMVSTSSKAKPLRTDSRAALQTYHDITSFQLQSHQKPPSSEEYRGQAVSNFKTAGDAFENMEYKRHAAPQLQLTDSASI